MALPLPGHHCAYSWHWWASPHVIFSNYLFIVICLLSSCSPSVACVISSPSNVISQGFLIVHSWLDHKVSSTSFFSFTLFRLCSLITLSTVISSHLAPVFSPPSFSSYSFIPSEYHHKTKQNPCLFPGDRRERVETE